MLEEPKITSDLWLVRHGITDWNVEGRYQGQSDTPLNETGLAQAQALAQELQAEQAAGKTFSAIYSSDLRRASATAQILADALGLTVRLDPRLREINQGEWEGKEYRTIVAQYRELLSVRAQDALAYRAPGGESTLEVAERVRAAADDIAAAHPAEIVLVVSHGVALACLIAQATGKGLQNVYSMLPNNTHPVQIQWPVPLPNPAEGADGR